jgi:predicted metal-dependent HD superfamily phosphohydrolase
MGGYRFPPVGKRYPPMINGQGGAETREDGAVDDLLTRWRDLVGPDADRLGRDLLERWNEPHRHYHTVDHLRRVLDAIDDLEAHATDPTAVRLAAWFHDAVYAGRPGDDEEASARLAEDTLPTVGVPHSRVAEVARLVRLTAGHEPAPGDANGAVLCDADLAVLAGEPDEYAAYAAAVREEHAHVADREFRRGRAAVLRRLLARDPLYRTATGAERWAAAARHNLTTELDLLSVA